jgi:hypothetical protein
MSLTPWDPCKLASVDPDADFRTAMEQFLNQWAPSARLYRSSFEADLMCLLRANVRHDRAEST